MMMELKWLWILAMTVLLLEGWWCSSDACWEHERIALLHLKPFFNRHRQLNNWVKVKGSDCCQWEGVECSPITGRVIGLSLISSYHGWDFMDPWYLNASLFHPFEELRSLNLSWNDIAGCVENEGFAKLSSTLVNLEILDLSGNDLNDSILSSLSELSSLKYLNLAGNGFIGLSHANGFKWLSRLSNLETLDLSGNSLENSILLHMGGISSSLKTLSLANNKLQGTVHLQELNNLTNLKNLDLSNNRIESLRPLHQGNEAQLRLMTNLEELDLSNNLLRNDTFAIFSPGLSSLKSLSMSFNQLQGPIDVKDLNNLINLKKLDLSWNQIESLRPLHQGNEAQLKLMTNLEELDLSSNLLRNDTFAIFSPGLSSLKSLSMSSNQLQGSIDVKDLINLKKLDLDSNQIESLLPLQDGGRQLKLTHLEELDLSNNLFNNSIFASLNGLSNLKSLHLDGNQLNGPIDMKDFNIFQGLGVLTSLKTLSLQNSGLTGTLPDQGWCDLKNLKELDISWNAIEGILSFCLDNLTSLRLLDISNNQFTGDLTPLANLRSLRYLSLSRNHFQVPLSFISLANLTNLKVLLIDENKLVMEPAFHTSVPKFQLNFLSLSNCETHPPVIKELPKFLYYQYDLRYVDLSSNNFSGIIPFWLLENNTKLELLFLNGNSFIGPLLLPQLPRPNLSSIDISSNKIQGQIPTSICSTFPHLVLFFLSGNFFEGNIPPCLGGMSDLQYLDLSHNGLSGGIPKELTMGSSLRFLRLSNNNLSGKILPIVFNGSELPELYLDGNNFFGEIPDVDISTINFFRLLVGIDLSNNNLLGKLPRWLWNLSALETLALSNNHFEGSIPRGLCNLEELEFLDLSQNNLSGSIPSCFNPPQIKHVHLSRNRLSGPLTRAFHNSSSLVTLDLGGNNLIGNIPEWIGKVSSLSVLLLNANRLDGPIPVQICKLYALSIIRLSQNMLSGPIPSCLGNLTLATRAGKSSAKRFLHSVSTKDDVSTYIGIMSREYLFTNIEERVEFTTKRGSYSYGGNILNDMSGIDLSCNQLTGKIPLELGNLSEIRSLNLSHNNLSGVIPTSFSNLKQVESLDLSYNNLSGRIPIQLVELNTLEVFSVAHNNLSGSTPERKAQFGTFDESSYEGNPLLCGPPLHNDCSKTDSPSTVSTASDDEGEGSLVDTYVFGVTFLVSYVAVLLGMVAVLYINPHWRRVWFSFIEDCIDTYRFSTAGIFLEKYIFKRRHLGRS